MTQYNLNNFLSEFASIGDLSNSADAGIPANPKQNVDIGKNNDDLAGKSTKESGIPENTAFNKKKRSAELHEKASKDSPIPSNVKFNKKSGSRPDVSSSGILEAIMQPTEVVTGNCGYLENRQNLRSSFVPQMDIRDVYEKIYMEAANTGDKPMFTLDLGSLVMDKLNCKFNVVRNNRTLTTELMYPNASGKLSIRVEGNGMGSVDEITLDSDEYRSLGDYIKGLADQVLGKIDGESGRDDRMFGDLDDFVGSGYNDEEMANIGAVPGNEHVRGGVYNSFKGSTMDSVNIRSFAALMEADEPDVDESEDEIGAGDVNASDGGEEFDVADLGDESGADAGGGAFDDMFGGDDSLGSMPSDSFDVSPGGGGDPSMAPGSDPDDAEPVAYFKEKEDGFDNTALVGMEKLLATEDAKASKRGSGMEVTPHESYEGTRGIKGKYTNRELIDQFLKVYPELDEIEIPNALLNDIEDKLSQQDGEAFDEYLKGILPEIRGEEVEVDFNALNNDMFNDFDPMGGEEVVPAGGDEFAGGDSFDFGDFEDNNETSLEDDAGDGGDSEISDMFDADLDMFNDIEPGDDEE